MMRCSNNIFGYCHELPPEATPQKQELETGPGSVVSLQTQVPGTCPFDPRLCQRYYSAIQECKDAVARFDLMLHPDNGKGKRKRSKVAV